MPTIPPELGPYPNRGSCVFAQTSVMRAGTSRDTRQQSRLIRGNKDGFEICTVNHAAGGTVRLDATISYTDDNHEVGVYEHEHAELGENENFVKVYSPSVGDECYIEYDDEDGVSIDPTRGCSVDGETIAWWHMSCGRVLGVYDGRLLEYEPSTLAPLGLVVGQDELKDKQVVVVGSGIEECKVGTAAISTQEGMEGADCADNEGEEQAVLLVDQLSGAVTVVQPNEDGSYWRKIVRNKMIRMKEKRRVQAAQAYADEAFEEMEDTSVVSSWGPYTSISGTATKTGVAGLTAKSKLTEKEVDKASVRTRTRTRTRTNGALKRTRTATHLASTHPSPPLTPRPQTSPPGHLPPTFPAPPSTSHQGAAILAAAVRALLSVLLQPHAPSHLHRTPIAPPSHPHRLPGGMAEAQLSLASLRGVGLVRRRARQGLRRSRCGGLGIDRGEGPRAGDPGGSTRH